MREMVASARGDTYKEVPSELMKCGTIEDALNIVRRTHPFAYSERSTGYQYSFWIRREGEELLVGHAWSTTGAFYRVRTFDEPIDYVWSTAPSTKTGDEE